MPDTSAATRLPHIRILRQEKNLRRYLAGQFVAITGMMLQNSVQGLLIVSLVGREEAATWAGFVSALMFVPGIVLAPFAGIVIDRVNKRTLLRVTAMGNVLLASVLAGLTYTHVVTPWAIAGVALCSGLVNAFDGPGRNAIVKDIVDDPRHVRPASKMFTSLYNLGQIAGPGAAGFLVLSVGFPLTFCINALSATLLFVALTQVAIHATAPSAGGHHLGRELVAGGMYTLTEPGIRLCILLSVITSICGYSTILLLPVLNKYTLGGNELSFGYLAAAHGAGSLLSALGVIVLERASHKRLLVLGLALQCVSLVSLSFMHDYQPALVCLFALGLGNFAVFSIARSCTMHLAKKEMMGIVLGYSFSLFYTALVVGSWGVGALADHVGMSNIIFTFGIVLGIWAILLPKFPGADELG